MADITRLLLKELPNKAALTDFALLVVEYMAHHHPFDHCRISSRRLHCSANP